MQKKLVLYGLLLIAISIVIFIVSGISFGGNVIGQIPTQNITVPSYGFSYMQINTSNASTAVVSAILSNAINVYIFNASNYALWQHYTSISNSVAGLGYALSLYHGNSSFVFANTALLMPENVSAVLPKSRLYNNSIYIVMDNTNGSFSSNRVVNARVVYL